MSNWHQILTCEPRQRQKLGRCTLKRARKDKERRRKAESGMKGWILKGTQQMFVLQVVEEAGSGLFSAKAKCDYICLRAFTAVPLLANKPPTAQEQVTVVKHGPELHLLRPRSGSWGRQRCIGVMAVLKEMLITG